MAIPSAKCYDDVCPEGKKFRGGQGSAVRRIWGHISLLQKSEFLFEASEIAGKEGFGSGWALQIVETSDTRARPQESQTKPTLRPCASTWAPGYTIKPGALGMSCVTEAPRDAWETSQGHGSALLPCPSSRCATRASAVI